MTKQMELILAKKFWPVDKLESPVTPGHGLRKCGHVLKGQTIMLISSFMGRGADMSKKIRKILPNDVNDFYHQGRQILMI